MSYPHTTDEYAARARSLGYATALEMCLDHDVFHVLLASWLALPISPALHAVAGGNGVSDELGGAEEAVVLALQRYVNLLVKQGWRPTLP